MMMNGPQSALRRMATLPSNAMSRMASTLATRLQQQQLERVTTARLFSSNNMYNPPPGSEQGSGGGGSDGGGSPYRLRRPAARIGGGNEGGGGGQPYRKRVNKYTNASPYVPATRGTRANAITLFPGNFQDKDDAFSDENYDTYDRASYVEEDPEEIKLREYMRKEEERLEAQRQKWLENAKPVERVAEIDERGRSYGRGGRKTAEARVWIQPGLGEVVVNHRPLTDYFDRLADRELVMAPLVATETCGQFDMQVAVQGGGLTGQAGAVRMGLARALNAYNPDAYRPALKMLGYLTRDARKVERKKVGHVKARKSPQWVRR